MNIDEPVAAVVTAVGEGRIQAEAIEPNRPARAINGWCIFCLVNLPAGRERETCPRALDRGTHEPYAMPPVRQGSSLHDGECPRSDPSVGLPDSVQCACRRLPTEEGTVTS